MNTQLLHTSINLPVIPQTPPPLPPPSLLYRRTILLSSYRRRPPFRRRPPAPSFPLRVSDSNYCINSQISCTNNSIRSSLSTDEEEEEKQQKPSSNKRVRAYPFHEIEPKWQQYWEEHKTFRTPDDDIDTSKPKYYVLDMFPYPRSTFFLLLFYFNIFSLLGNIAA